MRETMFRKPGSQPCCSGFNFFKNSLIILNVIYIVVGWALIGLAAFGKASAYIVEFSLFGGVIACGVFLLLIASVGILGTVLHHQVTLFFYMMLLVMLFIVQLSIACACLALTSSQQKRLFDLAWKSSPSVSQQMMRDFDCCSPSSDMLNSSGFNSTTESNESLWCRVDNHTLPCCTNSTDPCCTGQKHTPNDTCPCLTCWQKVEPDINHALKAAGAVGLIFSFSEVMGAWLAFRYRNQKNPYANPNDFL